MKYNKVYIVDAIRTPIGSFCGALATKTSVELGSALVKALISRNNNIVDNVKELIVGCVLSSNLGQAPARQVGIFGGLSNTVSALTINKVCSSGLFANLLGARSIELGISDLVIAGGIESMSNAPHYINQMRMGAKLGDQKIIDSIIKDGLWDVYNNFHMGCAGEMCAKKYNFSREDQDKFAISSYEKSQNAISKGLFKNEILPIEIAVGKSTQLVENDEEPGKLVRDKVSSLKPAFEKDGTITAVNASSLNDGAAMLLLASEEALKKYNLKPRARIIAEATHSHEPEWFTTAPVQAIKKCISNANLTNDKIDFYEINEAFSSVALACQKELSIPESKLNVRGGAVSLGHPIGASGARILVSLLNILESEKAKTGIAGICNGGGEATSLAIELV